MDAEERASLEKQLQTLKRRLHKRQEQRAALGLSRDPHIDIEIEDTEAEISRIEQLLTGVANHAKQIQDKKQELGAFEAMLLVLESRHATNWIFSKAVDILGEDSDKNFETLNLFTKNVRKVCNTHITRLKKELIELGDAEQRDKIFVDESPDDILNWYKSQNDQIERDKLAREHYIGKYVRWSGIIDRIVASGSNVSVYLPKVQISLNIEDETIGDLEVGKLINFTGCIAKIVSFYFAPEMILSDCQLVDS